MNDRFPAPGGLLNRRAIGRILSPVLIPLVALACFVDTTGPGQDDDDLPGAETRILFVGNSLTYVNDLPQIVQDIADAAGLSVSHATVASPNWSLEEHWAAGLANRIRELEPDVVVLQQGPSTLDSSREHLVHWTSRIAPVVREVGGQPALFMVWPVLARSYDLGRVYDSYRTAAEAVDGSCLPAGEAWFRALDRDPELPLYQPDGLHPHYLGSLVAAQTMAAVLFGLDPSDIPDPSGDVSQSVLDDIHEAVRESLELAIGPAAGGR